MCNVVTASNTAEAIKASAATIVRTSLARRFMAIG
jgi:hypothetical protein